MRLPPSIDALLAAYGAGERPFALTAVDDGRFPAAPPLEASQFTDCRLPREAHAGFLLYAGFAAQGHAVAQDLSSREGSYWHGIYHRLEPDDSNAMYWFRRVGPHEIHPELCEQARAAGWEPGRNWDHRRFVDFVADARDSADPEDVRKAERVQLIEWRLLFTWCGAAR